MFIGNGAESFIGALDDPLGTNIDPRPRRHLAIHHQASLLQFVEMLPGTPVWHQIGIGDQDPGRVRVGLENPYGFTALHQQSFVIFQSLQGLNDFVVTSPISSRPPSTAIDNQCCRTLRDRGIQAVHAHAQGSFREPTPGA